MAGKLHVSTGQPTHLYTGLSCLDGKQQMRMPTVSGGMGMKFVRPPSHDRSPRNSAAGEEYIAAQLCASACVYVYVQLHCGNTSKHRCVHVRSLAHL